MTLSWWKSLGEAASSSLGQIIIFVKWEIWKSRLTDEQEVSKSEHYANEFQKTMGSRQSVVKNNNNNNWAKVVWCIPTILNVLSLWLKYCRINKIVLLSLSGVPMSSSRGHSIPDYTVMDFVPHSPLHILISIHCLHLCLVDPLYSPYINPVHLIIHSEVLHVPVQIPIMAVVPESQPITVAFPESCHDMLLQSLDPSCLPL